MGRKTASAEKDEAMNRFLKKREQIKEQLRKFAIFLSTVDNNTQLVEVKVRLDKTEPPLGIFEETVLEIDLLDESRIDIDDNNEFEQLYYRCVAAARGHIEKCDLENRDVLVANSSAQQFQQSYIGVKLPNLGLQKFGGDYSKFQQFFETFQTLVHKNGSLDNIQRFYYLLDSLEGDAKRVLECLEVTSENYLVAIDLLNKRFYNKPIIIQAHLKELFDLPALNKESHQLLQGLADNIEKHTRALKTLGEPVEKWGRLIIFFLSRKLDIESKKEWEEKSLSEFKGDPNLSNFIDFLEKKSRILDTVDYNSKSFRTPNRNLGNRGSYAALGNSSENVKLKCEICKGNHFVYFCETFLALDIEQRSEQVKKLGLCYNCLRSSHQVRNCKSNGCRKCRGRHNTTLHADSRSKENNLTCVGTQDSQELTDESQVVATCSNIRQLPMQIVLSTAVIEIKNSRNEFIKCRALLDSGSQVNFVTEDLAKQLGLKIQQINMPISGISETSIKINYQINAIIKSVYNNFTANIPFLILQNVTANIPSSSFSTVGLDIPSNIKLADPQFHKSSRVDVLLGAGIFFDLLCAGQIRLGKHKPVLQKTVLGWIVSGPLHTVKEERNRTKVLSHHAFHDIQEQLEKFWAVEEFPIVKKAYSREEEECEELFIKTTTRDETGRFCVNLPTKPCINELGESLEVAKKRLYSLEKKFVKNSELKQKYCLFIDEYNSLGHMTKISEDGILSGTNIYYLPHHAVFNEFSTTTKLRVVFDASAKTSSGLSLNNALKVGPTIQDELFDILIRFRQNEVVLTADITKMYRQVNIAPEQRDLQRIVWRSSPDAELEHFKLNTVTYGTASASFLATRCLKEIANDIKDRLPQVSKIISKCFFVDDLILGTSSIKEAVELGRAVAQNLEEYGFPLCKWGSNKIEVLDALSSGNNPSNYFISDSDTKKTLGVFWNSAQDTLEYTIRSKSNRTPVTKRLILSIISQIFDPLGLVGPVTVRAKIILQKLWKLQLGWDESILLDLLTSLDSFYNELNR